MFAVLFETLHPGTHGMESYFTALSVYRCTRFIGFISAKGLAYKARLRSLLAVGSCNKEGYPRG